MAATVPDITGWFEAGLEAGATHMIVVCDTFDYEDYPIYVRPGHNPREVAKGYDGVNMQKIMEVYALWKPMEPQIAKHRVFDYEMPPADEPEVLARWSDAQKKWKEISLMAEGEKVKQLRQELDAPVLSSEERAMGEIERLLAEVRSWTHPEPFRTSEINGTIRRMIEQGITVQEFPLLGELIDAVLTIGFGIPDDIKEIFREQ